MKPLLIIDAGHGGADSGGGSNHLWKEKDMCLGISRYQFERCKQLGISAALTRYEDETISSGNRAKLVRDSGAQFCLSNHINAGGGDGAEIIHSIHGGKELADIIAVEIKRTGQNVRRTFTRSLPDIQSLDYYFMHRLTGNVRTLIIEYGFADSPLDDVAQLKDNHLQYAEAVIRGFCLFMKHPYEMPKSSVKKEASLLEVLDSERSEIKSFLHLPRHVLRWRVYPPNKQPVKGNEIGFLRPGKFGGLRYQIIDKTLPHVYIIHTRDFGRVQIYAHPNTGATFH